MNLQEIEAESKYYKLLTNMNNIMGMLDTVYTYLISNNVDIMPLSSVLKDLEGYNTKNIERFEYKYNNLLFVIIKVISKLDFARLIYKHDLFIVNVLTNIIDKLSNCANLNYKALNVEYAPIQQVNNTNNNNNNNKVAPIPEPKPIEIKINNLVKSNKIENVEQVTKEIKKQETKETEVKPNNKAFSGVYIFENAKNLKSMFYNSNKNQLLMTFKESNKTYLYNNVDDVVIAELIKHDKENNHATTYFKQKVVKNKNNYPYKLIT